MEVVAIDLAAIVKLVTMKLVSKSGRKERQ